MNGGSPSDGYWGRRAPTLRERGGRLPVALVFPELEDSALATLGWQVVYRLLASSDAFVVERFCLGPDTAPLGLDSPRPLSDFPLICLSLNFEGDLPVALALLEQSGLPLRAADRTEWPLVMAGGPLAFLNPFPLGPALDFVFVGEAEAGFLDIGHVLARAWLNGLDRSRALDAVAELPGVLLPGHTQRPVSRVLAPGPPGILERPAFSAFVSPVSRFPDMLLLEVNRGCPYGCRFCAAGFMYRPPRQARLADLQDIVQTTSPRRVGLVGTALTDWPDLLPFLRWLHDRKTGFSLSSLRADGLDYPFLEFMRRTGTRSLTFALEGSSSRLRRAMNKNLDENRFLQAVAWVSQLKFNHLKIYLILGWPDEGSEDMAELDAFLQRIQDVRTQGRGNRSQGLELVTVSASFLVPKPWTPMQWAPMPSEEDLAGLFQHLKRMVSRHRGMKCSGENPFQARVQALLARGDERLFPLLELAADGSSWKKILKGHEDLVTELLDRQRDPDEIFAWERLDIGVNRVHLWREWERFTAGRPTPPCPETGCLSCRRCGLDDHLRASGLENEPQIFAEDIHALHRPETS
ncbi:MAG: radical SAM protein [Deltaproteobacteria bacterium]|nr:radical SAM protein [Deltaproteobacteria bacterium]